MPCWTSETFFSELLGHLLQIFKRDISDSDYIEAETYSLQHWLLFLRVLPQIIQRDIIYDVLDFRNFLQWISWTTPSKFSREIFLNLVQNWFLLDYNDDCCVSESFLKLFSVTSFMTCWTSETFFSELLGLLLQIFKRDIPDSNSTDARLF